ncbi:hypothetical protein DNTS_024242 [Danionella cerebrum]|uniref:Uncharacterized protein n=1 Tax=Danionella cerebrum TaxID=2873325 RepID=A0A553R348_9TELE|nr:hypothetical protein DNTS_024242 [Danionella translucida]
MLCRLYGPAILAEDAGCSHTIQPPLLLAPAGEKEKERSALATLLAVGQVDATCARSCVMTCQSGSGEAPCLKAKAA